MKRKLKHIAPLSVGKIFGALYACFGLLALPFLVIAGLASAFFPHAQDAAKGAPTPAIFGTLMLGLGLFIPVIYGVMGFLGGIVAAALYNLFARWLGGIEVEVE